MTERISDPSNFANARKKAFQYLEGKIDAVAIVASAIIATLTPDLAQSLQAQISALTINSKGKTLSAYEQGFASVETILLQAMKIVADAQNIREKKDPTSH